MSKHAEPPSGPNPILSSKTGIRLTIPELGALILLIAAGVMGWARLDGRISRIEEHLGIPPQPIASQPVIAEPAR